MFDPWRFGQTAQELEARTDHRHPVPANRHADGPPPIASTRRSSRNSSCSPTTRSYGCTWRTRSPATTGARGGSTSPASASRTTRSSPSAWHWRRSTISRNPCRCSDGYDRDKAAHGRTTQCAGVMGRTASPFTGRTEEQPWACCERDYASRLDGTSVLRSA